MGRDTAEERLNMLENSLKSQAIIIEEQQKAMGALKDEIEKQRTQQARQAGEEESPSSSSGFFGGSILTNPNQPLHARFLAATGCMSRGAGCERSSP